MMKKTVIASMVLVTSLLATPVMAENNFGVDLESMSLEDLISLKDAVNERIAAKGGDNVIGQGTYVVGTDIKAANFKITPLSTMSDPVINIAVYKDLNTLENDTDGEGYMDFIKLWKPDEEETPDSAMLNLKENQVVVIKCGMATIEETKPSWAPEE